MAYSDLSVGGRIPREAENDKFDPMMAGCEGNDMVHDLITKILDDTSADDIVCMPPPADKSVNHTAQYPPMGYGPSASNFQDSAFNYPYGFGQNQYYGIDFDKEMGFMNSDPVADAMKQATPEDLNLLRLAAQQYSTNAFNFDQRSPDYYRTPDLDYPFPQDHNQHPYHIEADFKLPEGPYDEYKNLRYKNCFEGGYYDRNERIPFQQDFTQMPPNGYPVNGYPPQGMMQNGQFESQAHNQQQLSMSRQSQELARQMSVMMRPPHLVMDAALIGLNNMMGVNTMAPPPMLQPPMMDSPLVMPMYVLRNLRRNSAPSAILHARLENCFEQWRQLELERKRTEAKLALAYPGKAVSSSNSIPVPRLPSCPSRVDKLTVDMLREHTKVLTLMAKMESLRCGCKQRSSLGSRSRRAPAPEVSPEDFKPDTWRSQLENTDSIIPPHCDVEEAMLEWRNAVSEVQEARKRELCPQPVQMNKDSRNRDQQKDSILVLADAVKNLARCARRARRAMWCDLTLTVAMAPEPTITVPHSATTTVESKAPTSAANAASSSQKPRSTEATSSASSDAAANKDSTNPKDSSPAKAEPPKSDLAKQSPDSKTQQRRNGYRQRPQRQYDFYPRPQRYDNRFGQHRHPYHFLATGLN